MKQPRRRTVEIETLEQFDRRVARGGTTLAGWELQDIDLRGRGAVLERVDPHGALFLGCLLDPVVEEHLRARGGLVFPAVPDVPFDAYRARLYTPEELYDGLGDGSYAATLDARVYGWSRHAGRGLRTMLARSLHDLAVDDALEELVRGRRFVGVMGGHASPRGSAAYRDAARLGRSLSQDGLHVATGGGPGSMEAANLGAHLSTQEDPVLDQAIQMLAAVPDFRPSVGAWAAAAFDVRRRWPTSALSLGVPTWFYGHEPPNAFASDIAKYFENAIREDVLLHVCTAGTVFMPGQGGTVQEVFQDACENYYADPSSVAPMVLVGRDYWTRELPVWPLLQALAAGHDMERRVHLVDDPNEVSALLCD